MSVKKNTSNFLKLSGLSFTTIVNETMALIPDDGALGIYCYLASKPENWNICYVHLQNRFNKGRDYIQKRMAILKEIGLIETIAIKDNKNRVLHWETTLVNVIKSHNTEKPYSGKSYPQSTILKSHILEKPESGKTGTSNKRSLPIKEKEKKKEREREAEPKKPAASRPSLSDFKPNEENVELAKKLSINIDEELESFKSRHSGKGDLQYEFKRWIKQAHAYRESKNVVSIYKKEEPQRQKLRDYTQERLDREERERNAINK